MDAEHPFVLIRSSSSFQHSLFTHSLHSQLNSASHSTGCHIHRESYSNLNQTKWSNWQRSHSDDLSLSFVKKRSCLSICGETENLENWLPFDRSTVTVWNVIDWDRLPFTVIEHSLWHSAITVGMSELWWRTAIHRKIRKAYGKRIWKRNMEFEGERTLNSRHQRSKNRERDVWRTVWKLDLLNLTTSESQAPVKSEWVRQGRRAKVEGQDRSASQTCEPGIQSNSSNERFRLVVHSRSSSQYCKLKVQVSRPKFNRTTSM